jgi:hypothetical protein
MGGRALATDQKLLKSTLILFALGSYLGNVSLTSQGSKPGPAIVRESNRRPLKPWVAIMVQALPAFLASLLSDT